MKILVTGAKGQLGFDVVAEAAGRGIDAVGVDVGDFDITDDKAVADSFALIKPDAVIHCAAWTAVDAAEDEENFAKVSAVNVKGTENIAKACKVNNCRMLFVSTDYVFDGQCEKPQKPEDTCNPVSVYGRTKYEGELAAARICPEELFIVRISWVFGKNGNNFVKTMLKLAETRDTLSIVNDQIGTPTYTRDLAELLIDMVLSDKYGVYHATNSGGFISWYDFANEIFKQKGIKIKLNPVASSEFPTKAKRPFNSRLDKSKLNENGFKQLPDWKDAVRRFLKELDDVQKGQG
ncbi:MAG: dTDP-4-dehydrorhamnose reductase [Oscillospiraceae bacterium]|nr:dTDP-4-dehydrorhamnose reductase [Oscillospiraceae bacterium]